MSSNRVPCTNPRICGVQSHIAGSEQARRCSRMKKGSGRGRADGPGALKVGSGRSAGIPSMAHSLPDQQAMDDLMDSYSDEYSFREGYSLNEETTFRDNAIAVDPDGCGCSDCFTSDSISPADRMEGSELAMQHFDPHVERKIINRTSRSLYAVAIPSRAESWRSEGDPRRKYEFLLTDRPPAGENNVVREIPAR